MHFLLQAEPCPYIFFYDLLFYNVFLRFTSVGMRSRHSSISADLFYQFFFWSSRNDFLLFASMRMLLRTFLKLPSGTEVHFFSDLFF
jgi:hypothetical protein